MYVPSGQGHVHFIPHGQRALVVALLQKLFTIYSARGLADAHERSLNKKATFLSFEFSKQNEMVKKKEERSCPDNSKIATIFIIFQKYDFEKIKLVRVKAIHHNQAW